MKFLLSGLATLLLAASAGAEPRVIFLVRHAERADASGPAQADPALSATGKARAAALVKELRDAGISAIYTSEFRRAQQTASPLANSLGIKIEVVPAKDSAALLAKLRSASGNVLVVGHSNTVPEIIKALGVSVSVTIAEQDYDDLFLVVSGQPPRLIHLHYP
ncbi:MAG TPA: phosphoglycerate mutase family protein [Chthoniobacterales bacterium]|nr:phosphoglycerate mutase family protein [Chthoniobacterales bacterium]